MVTCVTSDQTFIRLGSLISSLLWPPLLSLSRLLYNGLHLHERLTPPFGSCAHCAVSNHRIRSFVRGLMHVEVNHAQWR
jgi:hypothetical protein